MTVTSLTPIAPDIERDRFGRPLVIPKGGGNPVAYTRCTTFVGCIEDTYNLSKWQQRMVALGLSSRPDLLLSVAAHRDDKKVLDQICEDSLEAAKAHAAATTGTALHSLTERMDRGLDVGVVPEEYLADLAAYADATADLHAVHIERFCVQDPLKVGGTPDRVVRYNGKRYIADLKTGSITYGYLKIAAQLAMYARSELYDITTGERSEHGAEVDKGIIIHLPAGTGECRLYWVDLLAGWEAVRVARDVRAQRAKPYKSLVTDFAATAAPRYEQLALVGEPERSAPDLAGMIAACSTPVAVRQLWATHTEHWTDALTELAKQRVAALQNQ